ncbi:MAG: hypothetical protein KAR42_02560 [candidate division Zixibacteria bacterium]|nr:hypothetical protein [candidate division Zixibacteria bacterium]
MFTSFSSSVSFAKRNRIKRVVIVFAVLLLTCLASELFAGVLAAPTVVFLSDKNRTGRIHLENPSNKPKEVEIYFSFGIPTSDSLGNINLVLQDSSITDSRSCVDWVRAFPRKIILPPNGSQVVRLLARPPKDLPDGEYWARIVVRSQEGESSIPMAEGNEQITTKLNMIMQTAISLKYRTGDLAAQIEMNNISYTVKEKQILILADLKNTGNVSYLGVYNCLLLDADNKVISTTKGNLAVYREMRKRINLPLIKGDYKLPYTIDLKITCEGRTDIDRNDIIFGNEIAYSAVVE